ncbi:uncharacterized protein RSE6_15199 [Rhynchosporium secalis]|uniref:Uncharacterized protein n=1 Tax=Rhynchosporium secalis TaxID=38038 RepID=A0A1E1MWT1_RHYSE|nr:uncharacterized protein RSE6_15199 [Rhynchosporium secalis]
MASEDAIAAYCFAFLILIVYTVDAIVQWRHAQDSSRKYLLIQLSIITAFFVNELVLLVVSQQNSEETREAMLRSLQGLSLLQGLVIEAICVSRGKLLSVLSPTGSGFFLMVYNYEIRKAVAEPERTDIVTGAGRRDRWSDLESDGSTNIIDNT